MAKLPEIADLAGSRLAVVVERTRPIARGVALLSTVCGGLAYLVGALVFRGSWRIGWLVVGLVCFIPAWAVWQAHRRLSRASASLTMLAPALASLVGDREVREAVFELADNSADPQTTPLVTLGKELWGLRSAVSKHRETMVDLWQTITAITTLPGLMAIGFVGSFALLAFSVVVVVVGIVV